MFWRLINDKPHRASFNMALDEAISEAVRKKISPPTLRLYQWIEPSVTIGYFQNSADINLDYCRKKNYPCVRRITGGKGVLHDSEVTYSFSSRTDYAPFRGGLIKNYLAISTALVSALKLINVNAHIELLKSRGEKSSCCFKMSSYGEITVNHQKIIGSAQKRYTDGFLQQGSIMTCANEYELKEVFKNYDIKESLETDTIKKNAPLINLRQITRALKEGFEKTFSITFKPENPSDFEFDFAKKLESEKYSTKEWNFQR